MREIYIFVQFLLNRATDHAWPWVFTKDSNIVAMACIVKFEDLLMLLAVSNISYYDNDDGNNNSIEHRTILIRH